MKREPFAWGFVLLEDIAMTQNGSDHNILHQSVTVYIRGLKKEPLERHHKAPDSPTPSHVKKKKKRLYVNTLPIPNQLITPHLLRLQNLPRRLRPHNRQRPPLQQPNLHHHTPRIKIHILLTHASTPERNHGNHRHLHLPPRRRYPREHPWHLTRMPKPQHHLIHNPICPHGPTH